jgi:hypothetical protein
MMGGMRLDAVDRSFGCSVMGGVSSGVGDVATSCTGAASIRPLVSVSIR